MALTIIVLLFIVGYLHILYPVNIQLANEIPSTLVDQQFETKNHHEATVESYNIDGETIYLVPFDDYAEGASRELVFIQSATGREGISAGPKWIYIDKKAVGKQKIIIEDRETQERITAATWFGFDNSYRIQFIDYGWYPYMFISFHGAPIIIDVETGNAIVPKADQLRSIFRWDQYWKNAFRAPYLHDVFPYPVE